MSTTKKISIISLSVFLIGLAVIFVVYMVDANTRRVVVFPSFADYLTKLSYPSSLKIADVDYVPTAECAVEIADAVSNAISNTVEEYKDFDPKQHDVMVRFSEESNVWSVRYSYYKLSKQDVGMMVNRELYRIKEPLHVTTGTYIHTLGPTVLVNKSTGEVTVIRRGGYWKEEEMITP
jgi:hypothetical protein